MGLFDIFKGRHKSNAVTPPADNTNAPVNLEAAHDGGASGATDTPTPTQPAVPLPPQDNQQPSDPADNSDAPKA